MKSTIDAKIFNYLLIVAKSNRNTEEKENNIHAIISKMLSIKAKLHEDEPLQKTNVNNYNLLRYSKLLILRTAYTSKT